MKEEPYTKEELDKIDKIVEKEKDKAKLYKGEDKMTPKERIEG